MLATMTVLRPLPYLLLALLLGVAGFAGGVLLDPLDRRAPPQTRVSGSLDPEAERLTRQIARLRAERSELAAELQRTGDELAAAREELAAAKAEIERLRTRLDTAETAQDEAQQRVEALRGRVADLDARQSAPAPPDTPEQDTPEQDAPEQDTDDGDTARPDASADAGARADSGRDSAADSGAAPAGPDNAGSQAPRRARPTQAALDATAPSPVQRERVRAGIEAYRAQAYVEAYEMWLEPAQAGVARAQFHLGALFFEGRGVPQDNRLAYAWLTLAQENGSPAAGALVRRLEDRIADTEREAAIDLITNSGQ